MRKNKLFRHSGRILLCAGVILLLYPVVSDCFKRNEQSDSILKYYDVVNQMKDSEVDKDIEEASTYNTLLLQQDMFLSQDLSARYQMILNPVGNGIMGIIDIAKIHVHLPIYHGTDEEVLESGVGHLFGSSLPIGGQNTHCILAGHRGTPSAELFQRLGEIELGDTFQIVVYQQRFVYQVCDIRVIQPDDTQGLQVQTGRDLVSLITCTPYGINSHRLVVTGERVEEKE